MATPPQYTQLTQQHQKKEHDAYTYMHAYTMAGISSPITTTNSLLLTASPAITNSDAFLEEATIGPVTLAHAPTEHISISSALAAPTPE